MQTKRRIEVGDRVRSGEIVGAVVAIENGFAQIKHYRGHMVLRSVESCMFEPDQETLQQRIAEIQRSRVDPKLRSALGLDRF